MNDGKSSDIALPFRHNHIGEVEFNALDQIKVSKGFCWLPHGSSCNYVVGLELCQGVSAAGSDTAANNWGRCRGKKTKPPVLLSDW
jgi:hypothetical protein